MIPKFRAWMKDIEAMAEVYSINFLSQKVNLVISGVAWTKHFSDVILMQSTGLKDKNGKEIFGGDVIKYTTTLEVHGTDEPEFAVVEFKNTIPYANHGKRELTIDDLFLDGSEWEVIGNIYENPELVEV